VFHYVTTEYNPADYGTRGKLASELFSSELWWNGPPWLQRSQSAWPKSDLPPLSSQALEELQSEMKHAYFGHTMAVVSQQDQPKVDFLSIPLRKMSSLLKLLDVSAFTLKFLKRRIWDRLSLASRYCKPGLQRLFSAISNHALITTEEYELVKLEWIKCVQKNHYTEVLQALQGESVKVQIPIVSQLGLQLDELGIIRAHGRYEYADLPEAARAPILLPKKDWFSNLVVNDVHCRLMHSGVSHTLSQVRLSYWIPCGRALTRSVISHCIICRRFKTAMAFRLPPMPPLPRERLERSAPFQSAGLDYFGPITVLVRYRSLESEYHEHKTKMWVCLYTCLTTRAVHLEPVLDQTAVEFLNCLIRFVSRRGSPDLVISDNAAQFELVKILGDQAWRRLPTDEAILSYAAANGIRWRFITELAPWQGGFYERLVGLVKSTLRMSIRNRLIAWTDLVTLLAETEAVVNSRPLTYVADDLDSSFRVIRPSDFLVMRPTALSDSPDGSEVSRDGFGDAGKMLVSLWKQKCRTLNKLWKIWYEDYLLNLRERPTVAHKAGRSDVDNTPSLNEVLLVAEPGVPRGRWRLARVTSLLPGTDGKIRAADLVLANGIKLRRPLNHLVSLEVPRNRSNSGIDEEAADPNLEEVNDSGGQEVSSRSDTASVDSSGRRTIQSQTSVHDHDVHDNTAPLGHYLGSADMLGLPWFSQQDIQRTIDNLQRYGDVLGDDASQA
jgi:hypothetical protein